MALLSESKMASSNELIRTSFALEFSIVFLINPKFPKTVEGLTVDGVGVSVVVFAVLDTALVVFVFLELLTVVTFLCAVVGGGVVVVVDRIAFFPELLLIDLLFLELVLLLLSVLDGKGVVVVIVVVGVVVCVTGSFRLFPVVVMGVSNAFNRESLASSTVLFFPDLSLTNNKTSLL